MSKEKRIDSLRCPLLYDHSPSAILPFSQPPPEGPPMQDVLNCLSANYSRFVNDLAELVAIPSISTDGEHAADIDRSADKVAEQMRRTGLNNVAILGIEGSYPYVYGEWLGAPGKPTVFLYAHHDVQPTNFIEQWESDPWTLTSRGGRLYGRGSADDKGAITAQLASVEAFLKTRGSLPVNVKVLVEGEEEVGSRNLMGFFQKYKDKIAADVIVVTDTENLSETLPCITYSLRGIVAVQVDVEALGRPVHSGMAGGLLPDPAIALNAILARLCWNGKKLPIPGFYDDVRKLTAAEKKELAALAANEKKMRQDMAVLPGVQLANFKGVGPHEQTWRWPAVTVIAQEASSLKSASNQVLPRATAIVSCRIVPDQNPNKVFKQLKAFLEKDPPWGVKVKVTPKGAPVKWWMTDPTGPAFAAAMSAMKQGYQRKPAAIGCGGTIGFVGPLADLLGGAPALLIGIEDPRSGAHSPNESLNENIFRRLMASLAHLYQNLGNLPGGKVKT
jgi:acetylornithine deacetylase/succinyl-diaminopimelate desuccinylase-like protein